LSTLLEGTDSRTTIMSSSKRAPSPTGSARGDDKDDALRVRLPDPFTGDRRKLKAFLIQTDLYMHFNRRKYNTQVDRTLWLATMLGGEAMEWIQPFLEDYMEKKNGLGQLVDTMKVDTIGVFQTVAGFHASITQVFGDINEERTMERMMEALT
jgi:hypothetical protein